MTGGTDRTTRRDAVAAGGRWAALGAAGPLALAAAACAGGGADGGDAAAGASREPATLRFASIGGEPRTSHFTEEARLFHEATPLITVEHESLAGTAGGYPKLIAQFASDTAPDGYETALLHGYFPTAPFVQANLPLESLLTRAKYDLGIFFATTVEAARVGGKQLGLPWLNGPGYVGMYVNLEAFERAGVRPPAESWTWDDYKTMVRQLSRPAEDRWGLGPWERVAGGNSDQAFLTLLRSSGGDLLSKDGTRSLVTEAPVVRALEQLADFHVTSSAAAPYSGSPAPTDVIGDFAAGRFATMLNNSTGRDQIKRGGWNPRYDILLPPRGSSGRLANSSPHFFCVTKAGRRPDSTFRWLQHLNTREAAAKVFEWVTVARKDVWDDPRFRALPGHATFRTMAEMSPSVIVPPNGEIRYYKEFISLVMNPVMRGEKAPRAAATEALPALEEILTKKG